ncbi:hypothetical protein IDVR_27800 [Intrasporangium sp. DVR]
MLNSRRDGDRLIDPGPVGPMVTAEAPSPRPTTTTRPSASTSTTARPRATTAPTYDADARPSAIARPSFTAGSGAPDVAYVHGTTVHDLVRDREVALEVAADSQLGGVNGLFADGSVLGTVLSRADWDVVIWDGATGVERVRLSAGTVLTFDSAHDRAVYTDGSDRLHVIDSSGEVVATAPRAGLLATGMIGDVVYANDIRHEPPRGYMWDLHTGALEAIDGRFGAVHGQAGLVIVFLPSSGTGSKTCFRLLDAAADLTVRWTACGDYHPAAFSPSGRFLLGGLGVDGGSPYDVWVMRVSDGTRVLQVDGNANELMLTGSAIDDGDRAITVVAQNAALDEALVRCPLDGSSCAVVGPPERLDTGTPFGISPPVWQLLP